MANAAASSQKPEYAQAFLLLHSMSKTTDQIPHTERFCSPPALRNPYLSKRKSPCSKSITVSNLSLDSAFYYLSHFRVPFTSSVRARALTISN